MSATAAFESLRTAMLGSGAVGLYWERLDTVKHNIMRLAPTSPPPDAGERSLLLFNALQAMLAGEQERSPEEIAAMLHRWMALEEEASKAHLPCRDLSGIHRSNHRLRNWRRSSAPLLVGSRPSAPFGTAAAAATAAPSRVAHCSSGLG